MAEEEQYIKIPREPTLTAAPHVHPVCSHVAPLHGEPKRLQTRTRCFCTRMMSELAWMGQLYRTWDGQTDDTGRVSVRNCQSSEGSGYLYAGCMTCDHI